MKLATIDNTAVFVQHQKQNRNSSQQDVTKPRFAKFSISLSSQEETFQFLSFDLVDDMD